MKKILKFLAPAILLMPRAAYAVPCPICTATVLVGLEGARRMGVDYSIIGVWAGGLFLALILIAWSFMRKQGIANPLWYLLPPMGPISLLLTMWILPGGLQFGVHTLFGIDKFLLGVLVGIPAFYAAIKWHMNIKKKNGGKSWFPLQKVVWPVGALIIMSTIFAGIVYL